MTDLGTRLDAETSIDIPRKLDGLNPHKTRFVDEVDSRIEFTDRLIARTETDILEEGEFLLNCALETAEIRLADRDIRGEFVDFVELIPFFGLFSLPETGTYALRMNEPMRADQSQTIETVIAAANQEIAQGLAPLEARAEVLQERRQEYVAAVNATTRVSHLLPTDDSSNNARLYIQLDDKLYVADMVVTADLDTDSSSTYVVNLREGNAENHAHVLTPEQFYGELYADHVSHYHVSNESKYSDLNAVLSAAIKEISMRHQVRTRVDQIKEGLAELDTLDAQYRAITAEGATTGTINVAPLLGRIGQVVNKYNLDGFSDGSIFDEYADSDLKASSFLGRVINTYLSEVEDPN
ncbi:hypothetical protein HN419_00715 [Candidatus Woesearchaeota archaeon]|jgi:hypothetical protein|nr:hypothetical protein [Candidatus Woesearchaeota archaeon]MBT3537481.1 hypothetical protein [Candidatus Woesearchaeota archaeon]MBT4697250.1 hypothetical protein [Candidatus Woesearchaeota archaeon]MBT4717606.1 hypothetical protein [Candidatus Woesearchaeota archaeon]MBT7106209.1 hypothetical protein [Candidatus Woesearchaeota archaeon]